MSLIKKLVALIRLNQVESRKNKDALKATLLTTLLGEIYKVGKDKGVPEENGNPMTSDEDATAVVKKFLKGVNDTYEYVKTAGNVEAQDVCLAERAILESYLPRQMTKDQIKGAIMSGGLGTLSGANKGQLMKYLKENFAGQYDGKDAAKAVDELLVN